MTRLRELYKCNICGNVVEITHQGAPALVCCAQPMEKLVPKTQDKGMEKHVPIIIENTDGITVQVGDVLHPMEDGHYIKFIEVLTKDKVLRAELSAQMKPASQFAVDSSQVLEVRCYCNLHGLWSAE